MRTAFIHSRELEKYAYPPDCPFKTQRASLTKKILFSFGRYVDPARGTVEVAPQPADPSELLLFHSPQYL
jgi:acetoin utilization deacetylase AcuC-like enzyme